MARRTDKRHRNETEKSNDAISEDYEASTSSRYPNRISQRNRKDKKDDQYEYPSTPTKKINKIQTTQKSKQSRKNTVTSKKANVNILARIKRDRALSLVLQ